VADGLRVKICGLTRREDALAADRAGADYLGIVLTAGFGRSVVPSESKAIFAGTRARKVAVLVDEDVRSAVEAARALGADVVQLHGDESLDVVAGLREAGPWTIWKAVRARSLEDVATAVERFANVVDGILVEGWKDGSPGGGGARLGLDPARVRALVPAGVDLILAGGLGPESVADAVRAFHPDVVDVSSGVERSLGVKDHERVQTFVESARGAAAVAGTRNR
jgi:phosphoribosylanthranilate isomerase